MLEATSLRAAYGPVKVLHDVSLTAQAGEITCLLGRNGAGKTSTLKALMGLLPLASGTVALDGEALHDLPAHEIPKRGIGYVPQGRRLFKELTVAETIEVGLMTRGEGRATRDRVLDLFPRLRERLSQRAGTLSGGEQQMLATARALCLRPKVLLLDEPAEGLQPSMIDLIRDVTVRMRDEGTAILLVEQRMDAILDLADRAIFLETGRSVETVPRAELTPDILHRRLGV